MLIYITLIWHFVMSDQM